MRKVAVIVLAIMASVVLVSSVMAEGVKDECVALCKDAAKFLNEKGLDAAIAEFGNKEGKFVTKNTYVYLMDFNGNRLAHPYATPKDPKIMPLFEMKDTTGKLFIQEQLEVAKTKGEGWTEYMYPKPEELKKPIPYKEKVSSKKLSYVYRVAGKDLFVVAGYFE
jgi:cytochrome c